MARGSRSSTQTSRLDWGMMISVTMVHLVVPLYTLCFRLYCRLDCLHESLQSDHTVHAGILHPSSADVRHMLSNPMIYIDSLDPIFDDRFISSPCPPAHPDISNILQASVSSIQSPPCPYTANTLNLDPLTHPTLSPVSVNARLLISAPPVHAFVGKISLVKPGEGVLRFRPEAGVGGGERL
jgi:hypothetical protein